MTGRRLDPRTPLDDVGKLASRIKGLEDRLTALSLPSGAQRNQSVKALQAQVNTLKDQLDTFIATGTYSRSQVDNLLLGKSNVGHTHDQAEVTGVWTKGVNTTAGISTTADVTGARGIFPTGVRSSGARNNALTTGYVAAFLDSDGNLGYAPSTRASKDVGAEYKVDMAKFLALTLFNWQYKNGGMKGIGPMADDLDAAGLTEFVIYNAAGKVQGLRIESLVFGLWSAYVQSRTSTLTEFAKRGVQTVTDTSMTGLGINAEKTVTITWPKPWADTNYAVVPTVTSGGLALAAIAALVPGSKTEASCKVTVRTIGLALGSTAILTVDGIHT